MIILDDLEANTGRRSWLRAVCALFYSPGFYTVALHRLAAFLHRGNALSRFGAWVIWRWLVLTTGCYIDNRAMIGRGFRLPHPTGVVIGEGVRLGNDVTIYHGVTIGIARSGECMYPILEDNCVVYAGAAIVGDITIGAGAVVGANAVVTRSVPSGTVAVGIPARVNSDRAVAKLYLPDSDHVRAAR
jgi:serine O-acetyltransferase